MKERLAFNHSNRYVQERGTLYNQLKEFIEMMAIIHKDDVHSNQLKSV